jgi:hypothetical protein
MKPEILARLEDYIRNDGIRTATTIAVRALVEYVGIDVDREFNGEVYIKTPRVRTTVKLTPEEKAERQRIANAERQEKTNKALKLSEFVIALVSRGETLDAKNMAAFDKWYAEQPKPKPRERKNKVAVA